MYTLKVEKECGCFKKSDLDNNVNFQSKDDALIEASNLSNHMNKEFCGKHDFSVMESGNDFIIKVKDADDHGGGCCGGGCH